MPDTPTPPVLHIVNGHLRWHRLIHHDLGCPLGGSPELARLLNLQVRLALVGTGVLVWQGLRSDLRQQALLDNSRAIAAQVQLLREQHLPH